jgi:hypothetical protein
MYVNPEELAFIIGNIAKSEPQGNKLQVKTFKTKHGVKVILRTKTYFGKWFVPACPKGWDNL